MTQLPLFSTDAYTIVPDFPARIRACWKDALHTFPEPVLNQTKLPDDTKVFLSTVGVPQSVEGFTFYTDHQSLNIFRHDQANFVIIGGNGYGLNVCIKENTGEIFCVDDEGELPTRYINSRIDLLLIFLEIWLKEQQLSRNRKTLEEAKEDANYLKEKFMALDAKALDDPENWWSMVLEQIEDGLL